MVLLFTHGFYTFITDNYFKIFFVYFSQKNVLSF